MTLSHINSEGRAKMVDVSEKQDTIRESVAYGSIYMKPETIKRIGNGDIKKGDVLAVAQVAGIMGAKNTPNIVPMCHPIMMSGCDMNFELDYENNKVDIYAKAKTIGKTGIEMEAITAVSCAAITIYDMCKAIDKEMVIKDIMLIEKTGGKSGTFIRKVEG